MLHDGEEAVVLIGPSGLAGMVGEDPLPTTDGHIYMAGVPEEDGRYRCGWYAAIELDPITG